MFGKRRDDGEETFHAMELVRLAFPRRMYTQSHFDYAAEVIADVKARAREVRGVRIVKQARYLRPLHLRVRMGLTIAAGVAFWDHAPEGARGAPLLLVHGAGGTHLHWPETLRALPGRRVLPVDLPGHGQAPPPGEQTIAAYARALWGSSTRWGSRGWWWAGHSMGGAIAITLALDAPGRVAGLFLVGTGARLRVAPAILEASANPARAAEVAEVVAAASFGPAAGAAEDARRLRPGHGRPAPGRRPRRFHRL